MFDNFENDFEECEESQKTCYKITNLINNGLNNLSVDALEVIKERHRLLIEQQIFWRLRGDKGRCLYDLKDYANWLDNFIKTHEY